MRRFPILHGDEQEDAACDTQAAYVVVAFKQLAEGIEAEPPKTCHSAQAAEAAAKILGHSHLGVIAWSRYADPAAGKYDDSEEFLRLGAIPEGFDANG